MIWFTRDTETLNLDLTGSVLCIHHKDYAPPIGGADTMRFAAFRARYSKDPALLDYDNIVIVGTNRIVTPSSRNDPVFEVLFSGTRHINKVSVDNVPFISQPWRTWFHFGITNELYSIYDYSYKAETDYNKFIEGFSDHNPFSLEEMIKWSDGPVRVDYNEYFTDWQIVEIDLMPDVIAEYEDLKAMLFETEDNPKAIVQKLSRFARFRCKQRCVPQPYAIFRKPRGLKIVKTNLKVDDYLVGQLLNIINLTNDYLRSMRNV